LNDEKNFERDDLMLFDEQHELLHILWYLDMKNELMLYQKIEKMLNE
jgi:hypothetical protein